MMTAAPTMAQDGKGTATKRKAPKVDWQAKKRAAAKKAEAEKKRAAAKKAAEEAAEAEAEAKAAEEELEEAEAPGDDAVAAPTEDAEDTGEAAEESQAPEAEPSEDAVVVEDDAEEAKPVQKSKRHRHRHPHRAQRSTPSPDRASPPPYTWAGPYTMEYIEGAEVPDGYTKVERVRKGLVIGGAVTLGVGWLMSATAAAAIDEEETTPLYIPVIGPWIAMGTIEPDGAARAGLFVNGMAQAAGAAMFIAGLAATETVLVRSRHSEVKLRGGVGNLTLDGKF